MPELALAVVVAALGLMAVGGTYKHHCDRARAVDTSRLLATLRQALAVYEATAGRPPATARADEVVGLLASRPVSAALLRAAPAPLLRGEDGGLRCVDAWGTPIRYISARTQDPAWRVRVQLAGGPIFESAGADRRFGDAASGAESDNLGSDALAIAAMGKSQAADE